MGEGKGGAIKNLALALQTIRLLFYRSCSLRLYWTLSLIERHLHAKGCGMIIGEYIEGAVYALYEPVYDIESPAFHLACSYLLDIFLGYPARVADLKARHVPVPKTLYGEFSSLIGDRLCRVIEEIIENALEAERRAEDEQPGLDFPFCKRDVHSFLFLDRLSIDLETPLQHLAQIKNPLTAFDIGIDGEVLHPRCFFGDDAQVFGYLVF